MKKQNKAWTVFGIAMGFAIFLTVFLYVGIAKSEVSGTQAGARSVLLIGTDEVARNTDTLLLLFFDEAEGSLRALQIPRDTFVSVNGKEEKINALFARQALQKGEREAAESLTETLSSLLGLSIERYLLFDSAATAAIVDALGGVEVEVPFTMEYTDEAQNLSISIQEGKQNLTGEEALGFLRFRNGYLDGDLGRLDAQMIFLSALAERLKTPPKLKECLTIYQKIAPKVLTNLTEKDIIYFVTEYLDAKASLELFFTRLAGEGYRDKEGVSYFVVNRLANDRLMQKHFSVLRVAPFDRERSMLQGTDAVMTHIYDDPNASYRVYTREDIKEIHIKRR